MRKFFHFVFLLGLFLFKPALASPEYLFKGKVKITEGSYRIFDEITAQEYNFFTRTQSIIQTILQLETGDYIAGAAYIDPDGKLLITNIDFVGLNRLLGCWRDKQHILQFDSMTSMSFWIFERGRGWNYRGPFQYTYSLLTMDEDESWNMIINDDDKVILALLRFIDENHITVSLFNSEDGSIDKIYELERSHFNR